MKEMMLAVGVENYTIRYFRTEGNMEQEGENKRVFGVASTKYIDDTEKESADTGFISEDMAYVDELIATLGRHTVTPVVLCEIVDDMLA